jgi:hypothetical protein
MEQIKYLANLPGKGNKIITKIFSALNVESLKSKSKGSNEEKLMI